MTRKKKFNPYANAEKQRRFRDKQHEEGKKMVRGYVSPEAMQCYEELREKTGWNDNDMVSNAIRLMYASYKCGQVKLLNEWLKDHHR